jgi:tRNA G10  N-methylase Trm11
MYKRFIRWASDRIADNGLVCFVVNRSFIDKKQDDGFRKTIEKEFDYCGRGLCLISDCTVTLVATREWLINNRLHRKK